MEFVALKRADKEAVKPKITVICPIMLFTNRDLNLDSVHDNKVKQK